MASDTFAEAGGFSSDETSDGNAGMAEEAGSGLVVDLSGVSEKGNYKVLPRGIYPVSVVALEFGKSKASGNNMWTWQFQVEEGHEGAGSKFFYHTVFNEGGMPRVKRTLARIVMEDGSNYAKTLCEAPFSPERVADEGRLLGARCRLKIDYRTYQGAKQNDVKEVLPPLAEGAGSTQTFAGV
jgi:hypothetical protein